VWSRATQAKNVSNLVMGALTLSRFQLVSDAGSWPRRTPAAAGNLHRSRSGPSRRPHSEHLREQRQTWSGGKQSSEANVMKARRISELRLVFEEWYTM
jgi:hypothetical protein